MSTEISGSVPGVDVNAAIQVALSKGDPMAVYEVSNVQLWPTGFVGGIHQTVVTLKEVTPTVEESFSGELPLTFTMNDVKEAYAWWNIMPGTTPTLHVKGKVVLNEKSYAVRAEFAGYEKSNPPNMLIKLTATKVRCPQNKNGAFHFNETPSSPGSIGSIKLIVPEGDPYLIEEIDIAT